MKNKLIVLNNYLLKRRFIQNEDAAEFQMLSYFLNYARPEKKVCFVASVAVGQENLQCSFYLFKLLQRGRIEHFVSKCPLVDYANN